jgi:hypothetical protein
VHAVVVPLVVLSACDGSLRLCLELISHVTFTLLIIHSHSRPVSSSDRWGGVQGYRARDGRRKGGRQRGTLGSEAPLLGASNCWQQGGTCRANQVKVIWEFRNARIPRIGCKACERKEV